MTSFNSLPMVYVHFSKVQRLELSLLRSKGYSQTEISKVLGVSQSAVSRELKRNIMQHTGVYDPTKAHRKSHVRRMYSKYEGMKISRDKFLFDFVSAGLKAGWTPEEISGRLKRDHAKVLSFKVIYKWLYSVHGRGYAHLLCSKRYQPKRRIGKKSKRQHIPNRISISLRPKVINERLRIGDFEGDTMGKPKHMPHTLVAAVDRKSRYLVAKKVKALRLTIEGFKSILPPETKSLTLDNGVENVRYEELKLETYFCHPYSSWEKGTVENTFQRLRRYIPKKANLAHYSPFHIATFVERMNNTPRKCLDYRTPAEVFKEHFA